MGIVRHPLNRHRLRQLGIVFSQVPPSTDVYDDWVRHRVDRSMQHYDQVMSWVGLFLFRQGLATFAGPFVNRALLFPMEQVFEDFVASAVRRYQRRFTVFPKRPIRYLAKNSANKAAFRLKPDIVLKEQGKVQFVLDAKWKPLDPAQQNHGVSQGDAYQLFAYGKMYGCGLVILVYPRTTVFRKPFEFQFVDDDGLRMACFPFNVAEPEDTIRTMRRDLLRSPLRCAEHGPRATMP